MAADRYRRLVRLGLRQLRPLAVAVGFLTRVALPWAPRTAARHRAALGRAAVYFPLVGGLVGASTASVLELTALVWPVGVAVVLALAWEAWLTGALHEDAVADCCDAFGGGWSREDVLRILKDSRVGSFGALGLTLAVLARAGATASLPPPARFAAVVAAAALGRWAALLVM